MNFHGRHIRSAVLSLLLGGAASALTGGCPAIPAMRSPTPDPSPGDGFNLVHAPEGRNSRVPDRAVRMFADQGIPSSGWNANAISLTGTSAGDESCSLFLSAVGIELVFSAIALCRRLQRS